MTGQTNAVGDTIQNRRNRPQDIAHVRFNLGTAGLKHRAVLTIDNLNTQPFLHQVDFQMRAQRA
ncbi:hypothetical protein D3C81_2014380 [compost metagenome]